eukprot:TRINITY_DN4469_c0_g1_i1.p1 TRINITY_DN4469_c0_g1~~TRINITY_DN4469_c0_g1_i1.p1  ORF type:complete len:337 (-),score=74.63 TRINITY_DN4469_c0_g1_i1:53-1063(-)
MSGKSRVQVVFGAMTFGNGAEQSRVRDLDTCAQILDVFQKFGHNEIDTARVYGGGTSEEYLAKLEWKKRGIVMATKFYPTNGGRLSSIATEPTTHEPKNTRKYLDISLQALGTDKIDLWYFHGPDRISCSFEEQMRGVNKLYEEGRFKRFGLSNYAAWEVAQICGICEKNGWIKPTVYQGVYNALHRSVEPELFPCLRAHGIAFYAFNPLGGGFLCGKFDKDTPVEVGSRFDPHKTQGSMYRKRYWNEQYFAALDLIRPVAAKHGLTLTEVALRWINHHSLLAPEHKDAIIIGASSVKHIEENLIDLEKGPLPQDVIDKVNEAWELVKPITSSYFH